MKAEMNKENTYRAPRKQETYERLGALTPSTTAATFLNNLYCGGYAKEWVLKAER